MSRTRGGTVTVLFTDIVGSTDLFERLGEQGAERVRRAHFRLLRRAVARSGGQEVKSMGDGLMVVFSSTLDALACAIEVQQGVHAHNQRDAGPSQLQVRVGIDVGEPIRYEADYFGMPVVVARRLCDSCHGGQVIVSGLVRRLSSSRPELVFRELGERRLKGISEPIESYELAWEPGQAIEAAASQVPLSFAGLAGEGARLVGRETEMETLRRAWDASLSGRQQLVIISGEAGIGKTRLAQEFAIEAEAGGGQVLLGRASPGNSTPFQPLTDALRTFLDTRVPDEVAAHLGTAGAALVRQIVGVSEDLREDAQSGDRESRERHAAQIERAISQFLMETATPSPILLVLDDLQWADAATLDVLSRGVRGQGGPRLLIVATHRDDGPVEEALVRTLASLSREHLLERVALAGLSEEAVGSLVATWAGQDAPRGLTGAIWTRTEGNPFFVEEVLRHLAETKAIYDGDGRLRSDAGLTGIPEAIKDLIAARLSRLSSDCNSVLTVAAVIGRDFGLDALARASDLSETQLVDALEEAVHAMVVREMPGKVGRYAFAHALVYETLYETLTSTRRVRLHGQTLQYADNDGVKLAYELLGAAGPCVMAVGVSNCPAVRTRNLATTRRWNRLAEYARILLYDRRGVGYSSAPERGYSLFASVEDMRAVLDAAGVERAILWGATDGGPLAIAFAGLYPERVAGLLLLGTSAKYTSTDDYPWGVNLSLVESFMRADVIDRGRAVSQLSQTRSSREEGGPGPAAIAEVMQRVPRHAWSKLVRSIGAADARAYLSQLRAPTLIIHDPDNEYIPVGAAQFLQERIAGSELLVTEEWGKPLLGEEVYGAVRAFIEGISMDR